MDNFTPIGSVAPRPEQVGLQYPQGWTGVNPTPYTGDPRVLLPPSSSPVPQAYTSPSPTPTAQPSYSAPPAPAYSAPAPSYAPSPIDPSLSPDQVKSMFPKYSGWNDPASIMADYKAGNAGPSSAQSSSSSSSKFAQIDPSLFQLPTQGQLDQYMQDAYTKLKPYYDQLLTEAKGDFTEATKRLEEDYQKGTRYNTQDTELATQRQNEDVASAMEKLGVTFKGEKDQQTDTLNKRGIALTEDPTTKGASPAQGGQVTYDANGNPVYSGQGGQAGQEIAMLGEDQRLRKEAETRASQRNLQDIGIKSERTTADLSQTEQRGQYDTGRDYQKTLEGLQQQKEQQATTMASTSENRDIQQKQLDLQKQQLELQQKSIG